MIAIGLLALLLAFVIACILRSNARRKRELKRAVVDEYQAAKNGRPYVKIDIHAR